MELNPLLVVFLLIAVLIFAGGVGLVLYQRHVFRSQREQVQEILREMRETGRAEVDREGSEPEHDD